MKRVVVLGGGESGVGAALLARQKGFDVFVSDFGEIKPNFQAELTKAGVSFEEGRHTDALILNADEVVKSPGIPDKAPIIKALHDKGTPIISEIEFGARFTKAKMICITGSNGKTTTTMLLYHILQTAGYSVGLAGNVGTSLARQVAANDYAYFVVELSSFQLEGMYEFRAHEAILLNIAPDHLDRYNYCMQNYVDAKMRIIRNQQSEDSLIYWTGDPILCRELEEKPIGATLFRFSFSKEAASTAFVAKEQLHIQLPEYPVFSMAVGELSIKGPHNLLNAMAAGIAALRCDVSNDNLYKAYVSFQGVEHRLEKAGEVDGVVYINDSKATNVNSCFYALSSMTTPTVLILGGTDKGNDYTEIEPLVMEKVKALVFMGVDNEKLHIFFDGKGKPTVDAYSMKEAVEKSQIFASTGETVLLSPCCASFDLFQNYEDRGRQFKEEVSNIVSINSLLSECK